MKKRPAEPSASLRDLLRTQLNNGIVGTDPHIVSIQETHLNPADKIKIPNFSIYWNDRTTHRGVTLQFSLRRVSHTTRLALTPQPLKTAICIDLPYKKQITVVSIYRPPHGLIDTAELSRIFCSNSQVICFGDFNTKHSSWNIGRSNRNGPIIYDWVNSNNFSIIAPLQPTYFSDSYNLNATLDFAVVKNINAAEAVAFNALPSDHNPVWYEFLLSNVLPIPLRSLTTISRIRFQEIISRTIPGSPSINNIRDIEEALAEFECGINTAINLSSKTRSINTTHHKLPPFTTNKITRRNNIRKRWQYTRYPPFKTESNKLTAEIKNDIETWDNNKWKELQQGLNTEDISLYNMARKLTKK
ncbi:hypothetical protein AVEN_144232-1 [Araneus ventricosus]|uniref:Endonuclease/exonuclease/phosphatase domain-containing protein n=1 Tax=Araneus ventricosus TaxID=182803 RepID=A0A4Y2QWV6_ARAVE|nr:hypothetical protein AVEN_165851-1 [Araneus ventricosus]GBN67615.1 hypothetical protein AVEN_144232-1 [Araneus ventricosus]